MMESNFPVDKISCSYTVLFNALKKCVKSYSKNDKRKLFEFNAKRIYGIDDLQPLKRRSEDEAVAPKRRRVD